MRTDVCASRDPEAMCPTCRAPFPIGVLGPPHFPRPSTDGTSHPRHVHDTKEVSFLYFPLVASRLFRGRELGRDKVLLMGLCEATQGAVSRLTSDERNARPELVKAKEEARIANESFESLKIMYRSLESIHLDCTPDTKRKSSEAALDSSSLIDSPASSPRKVKVCSDGRPVKPIPKRTRLQPTTTGLTAQNLPAPTTTP
ncbi:hypothetical protein EDB86DRAFT_2968222 [Lactarius hatsudake]|nr:hypothetical protein EDB86DRAFT_2968222 [Lactarius hatsudake]